MEKLTNLRIYYLFLGFLAHSEQKNLTHPSLLPTTVSGFSSRWPWWVLAVGVSGGVQQWVVLVGSDLCCVFVVFVLICVVR